MCSWVEDRQFLKPTGEHCRLCGCKALCDKNVKRGAVQSRDGLSWGPARPRGQWNRVERLGAERASGDGVWQPCSFQLVVQRLGGRVQLGAQCVAAHHEAAVDEAQAGILVSETVLGCRLCSASKGVQLPPRLGACFHSHRLLTRTRCELGAYRCHMLPVACVQLFPGKLNDSVRSSVCVFP